MDNVSHKKGWGVDSNPDHVEPHPIPLIKENSTGNSDGYDVKLKMRRDSTSSKSDLYEFRMYSFDHGDTEEFLSFVQNFQMTLSATEKLERKKRFNIFVRFSVGKRHVILT